ncbi:MAG: DUF4911 domain-containing protein [Thermodesulfobacteriota bacterium]|nr:DUF4911 domain-containing protein [Thermodesulfobacteriota bacterium]
MESTKSLLKAYNLPKRESYKLDTIQKYFKVDSKNISFLNFILEAYEGIAVMRTVCPKQGIVELMIAPDFENDVEHILDDLKRDFSIQAIVASPPD